MPIDAPAFKQALAQWASGVTVVTCRDNGRAHGMTASAFASVSLDPPLVLVCVARHNRTHSLIAGASAFGIHILGSDMQDLSNRCAGFQGEEAHWLDDEPLTAGATGAPILSRALAWLDCTLWRSYDGGDHAIYVGEVHAAGSAAGSPLLWYNRGYRSLEGGAGDG